ncbi:hypothetical protein [Streptomyces sp. 11x1]|uniref:hypothetical protein n=1 Tax=Streptomyces sp. 11x1 TaxID=3038642 RepID=UPI00292D799F|nr:hypothetical protein [Streptomyces sp. 11x1]WNZ10336.1 hypothetical protein P8T65_23975 [Streptomyces sp. 11x1]
MHPIARSRPTDTPCARVRRYARCRVWLRVLALTIVLLIPTAHAATHAAPSLPLMLSSELPAAECDLLESAPGPQNRSTPRPVAPPRSAPVGSPRPAPTPSPGHHLHPVPPWPGPTYALHALRSVVLRC